MPRTTFIGRERELADVQRLLRSNRLLTLIGPGGTGKTRVALKAADAVLERYADGVYFVGLTPISDPRLVIPTIAQVLTVSDDGRRTPLEALTNALRQREVLLILDNFEQVLDAAPDIGELLGVCPRAHVLVTSRAPLRISGEQELSIPPLGPAGGGLAVRRARASGQTRFRLDGRQRRLPSRSCAASSTDCPWRSSWPRRAADSWTRRRCWSGSNGGCRS